MAMIGKVKRMHFREKKSVREIVRLTSLSRKYIRLTLPIMAMVITPSPLLKKEAG